MALRTRKPTGTAPWPLILLEGEEKAGKSYAAAMLSASERVSETYWFDLGEGAGDEYGALPGTRYLLVEHNGTYADFSSQLFEALAVAPSDPSKPNVIVIDSISTLWSMLVDEAGATARSRGRDDVTMDLWNVAKRKWRAVMDRLMTYQGIVILCARGKEVAEVENGRPTNRKTWKVEGEKSLAYDATVWVRLTRPRTAELVGARSLSQLAQRAANRPVNLPDFNLEALIFDGLGFGSTPGGTRDYRAPLADGAVGAAAAKRAVVDAFNGDTAAARAYWSQLEFADAPAIPKPDLDAALEAIRTATQSAHDSEAA